MIEIGVVEPFLSPSLSSKLVLGETQVAIYLSLYVWHIADKLDFFPRKTRLLTTDLGLF